jgi:diamine N-acetyltransferase
VRRSVTLREVSAETVRAICSLETTEMQKNFVASNALSIAQAYFEPTAEFRAIYAGEEPVGFIMWRKRQDDDAPFLWRFMIDHRHQSQGYGRQALEFLIGHLRLRGYKEFDLSFVPGESGPEPFYAALGFRRTGGTLPNGECVMRLPL